MEGLWSRNPGGTFTDRLGQEWLTWVTLYNSIHALGDPTPATMPDVYDLVGKGNRVAVFVSLLQLVSTEVAASFSPGHDYERAHRNM